MEKMGFYSPRVCSSLWRICVGANGQGVHPDITEYLGWEDLLQTLGEPPVVLNSLEFIPQGQEGFFLGIC